MRFADLTTLHVGGPIAELVEARSETELIEAVRTADEAGRSLLVLGGGSNILASDEPFEGTVVALRDPAEPSRIDASCELTPAAPAGEALQIPEASCGGALVEHFAGVLWDRAVAQAVQLEMVGIEALSGIPGTVGATPIQNVGAYGQDVSQTISRVRTWDRHRGEVRTFYAADCAFAYRDSIFKRTPYTGAKPSATGRYVVLSVTFQHRQGSMSAPIRYAELARRLGVEVGARVEMADLRREVLAIRAAKGMVLIDGDHDTWSAGSFFTNPILTIEQAQALPAEAPRFDAGTDAAGRALVKTSAAWLISHAGFERGFAVGPRASLSTRHSLALTNRGGATSTDIQQLARAVQDGVRERYGITLHPEPVRLGVDL